MLDDTDAKENTRLRRVAGLKTLAEIEADYAAVAAEETTILKDEPVDPWAGLRGLLGPAADGFLSAMAPLFAEMAVTDARSLAFQAEVLSRLRNVEDGIAILNDNLREVAGLLRPAIAKGG
jgi:hypothetical protein